MATRLTRRGLLQGAAAGVAAACAPRESGKDSGDPAVQPGKIEHIVMVMMENRSFDHWYGARALHEGRSDEDGLTAGMSNPSPQGEDIPVFHATELCPNDPPHGWSSSHDQFNAGACDGFARVHGTSHGTDGAEAMAYLQREDLPISYALADGYRLCDRYFCSLMTGTWPNRLYGQMGSSQGLTGNSLPSDGSGLTDASVWKKLDEAGVDWGFYYSDLSFLSLLHNQVDVSRGKGIEELFSALERGELPPVVWVDPAFSYNDNHPPHHPALGELFLAALHEALATSPLWDKVLVLIPTTSTAASSTMCRPRWRPTIGPPMASTSSASGSPPCCWGATSSPGSTTPSTTTPAGWPGSASSTGSPPGPPASPPRIRSARCSTPTPWPLASRARPSSCPASASTRASWDRSAATSTCATTSTSSGSGSECWNWASPTACRIAESWQHSSSRSGVGVAS